MGAGSMPLAALIAACSEDGGGAGPGSSGPIARGSTTPEAALQEMVDRMAAENQAR